ncbi:hypothetical protein [Streptomyces sp. NPDC047014]|uniref:hypothetical protein n=1 Tax=Streptomyces sp. NPDC047014 TaxID=3155736 RepID=UPI0033EED936
MLALNVIVTNPTGASHLIVHPHGVTRPGVANLSYTAEQTVAHLVVVPRPITRSAGSLSIAAACATEKPGHACAAFRDHPGE